MFFHSQALPECYASQILTQERHIQSTHRWESCLWKGEPFTIVCNLFSKIYFVTIYLSFKKGKLLPTPQKKLFFFFFHNSCWCGCVVVYDGLFKESWRHPCWIAELGGGSWSHTESIPGLAHSQSDSCWLASGQRTTNREGMGWSGELGVGGSCLAFLASCE